MLKGSIFQRQGHMPYFGIPSGAYSARATTEHCSCLLLVRSTLTYVAFLCSFLALSLPALRVMAQDASVDRPLVGVDWEAPSDFGSAASDLMEIAEVGFSAVRMPPVFDRAFYSLADSLGLTLFIELPFAQLSSRALQSELAQADSLLSLVLAAGQGHASAGPVGITRLSDTRSPGGCDAIARVAERIRAAGRRAYYTSSFLSADRCTAVVDMVLFDLLSPHGNLPALASMIAQVSPGGAAREATQKEARARDTPSDVSQRGIAGLGAAITRPEASGWMNEGSPQAQARFMETALNQVVRSRLPYVFVHRWRDQAPHASTLPAPWARSYGLYTEASDPRPALQVVRGILRGFQDTFAVDKGVPPPPKDPWYPVLGWLMVMLTALLYAGSPRFRTMIPRYFFAHGFFRNAVREAREVLPLTSTIILTIIGLSIGLIGSFVFSQLRELPLSIHLLRLLSPGSRAYLTAIMGEPLVLTVLIGSGTLLCTSVWMGCWMALTRWRARLLPSQALMLASWPRWQILLILPVAMTLEATPGVPLWAVLCLGMVWLGTAVWATIRTTFDLYKITTVSPLAAGCVWMLHPLNLGIATLLGWSLLHWDQVRFAWHLLVST